MKTLSRRLNERKLLSGWWRRWRNELSKERTRAREPRWRENTARRNAGLPPIY